MARGRTKPAWQISNTPLYMAQHRTGVEDLSLIARKVDTIFVDLSYRSGVPRNCNLN